ncbi:MAG: DDE-type integrase/transposase/recombinase [Spiroplasma ixodetis]|nr:DDE-type integrase/transposase/recombinase [Spiroplasma ixodetis]
MAANAADIEDCFFETEPENMPYVKADDVSRRTLIAKTILMSRLDLQYLEIVQSQPNKTPKEMLEAVKEFAEPKTNAAAMAAWLDLIKWSYDFERAVGENTAAYEKIVRRYNISGEVISERMKRDIFVMGLPNQARKTILNHLRMMESGSGTYEVAKNLLREIEKERENVRSKKERKDDERKKDNGKEKRKEAEAMLARFPSKRIKAAREQELCYFCKKPGHISRECFKKKPMNCYACGEKGHKIAECPLIEKRNSQKKKYGGSAQKVQKLKDDVAGTNQAMMAKGEDSASDSGKLTMTLDSGASEHFVSEEDLLLNKVKLNPAKIITCANGGKLKVEKGGSVFVNIEGKSKVYELKDVLSHESFSANLMSVRKLVLKGFIVIFDEKEARVISKRTSECVICAPFDGDSWKVVLSVTGKSEKGDALVATESRKRKLGKNLEAEKSQETPPVEELSPSENKRKCGNETNEKVEILWHQRFAHAGVDSLRLLSEKYPEMKGIKFTSEIIKCEECVRAKFAAQACNKERERADRPLQLIHSDVCSAFPSSFRNSRTMFVSFLDDYSRYVQVFTMQYKNEVADMFEKYLIEMKYHFGEKFKIGKLRCDNGKEYINSKLESYCQKEGVLIEPCPAYTSQLNGAAERFNRTLQDKIRALLFDSGYPTSMWEYAAAVGVYVYNRLPSKSIALERPYERIFGKIPRIDNLRRFGSLVYTINNDPGKKKVDEKGVAKFMLCYTNTGYKVLDPKTNKIESVKHARFFEDKVYGNHIKRQWRPEDQWLRITETKEGEKWLQNKKTLTKEKENESKLEHSEESKFNSENSDTDFDDFEITEEVVSEEETENLRGVARVASSVGIPLTIEEALRAQDAEEWKEAIEAEYNSIRDSGAILLVDRQPNMNVIDSKWVFRVKLEPDGKKKYKARLVIRGFKERKVYEKYETYAPVAKISVVRLLIALANKYKTPLHQLDVKTAFLNGEIDNEVFIEIPKGFTNERKWKDTKVIKLQKALYGLKMSPRKWNDRFDLVIKELGMTRDAAEPCAYSWKDSNLFVVLIVYVDDILITGTSESKIAELKKVLNANFKMNEMKKPEKFLGMTLERKEAGKLCLHQAEFTLGLVNKYRFGKEKVSPTPIVPLESATRSLEKEGEKERIEEKGIEGYKNYSFREIIGGLLYLANTTRPDIALATNQLSRKQEAPEQEDWRKVRRVLNYLKGTINLGLEYEGKGDMIEGFVDASFASNSQDRKSTTGYIIKFWGDTITWKSKKQGCVSTSAAEAEYVALSSCSKEIITLKDLCERLTGKVGETIPNIYEDNRAVVSLVKSKEIGKLRHVDISYHHTKWLVEEGKIQVNWISSENQTSDFLTKPLPKEAFIRCREKCIQSQQYRESKIERKREAREK